MENIAKCDVLRHGLHCKEQREKKNRTSDARFQNVAAEIDTFVGLIVSLVKPSHLNLIPVAHSERATQPIDSIAMMRTFSKVADGTEMVVRFDQISTEAIDDELEAAGVFLQPRLKIGNESSVEIFGLFVRRSRKIWERVEPQLPARFKVTACRFDAEPTVVPDCLHGDTKHSRVWICWHVLSIALLLCKRRAGVEERPLEVFPHVVLLVPCTQKRFAVWELRLDEFANGFRS